MRTKRKIKRLTRKARMPLQTLTISFNPDDTGVDVVANYQHGKSVTTRFEGELSLEEMEEITDVLFNGYTYTEFQAYRLEPSKKCSGWIIRSKKSV
jgi:cytochrome oxidase Cu insertion factor (SCO1/SenC/PrrC family)